jgi:hypothetical protein
LAFALQLADVIEDLLGDVEAGLAAIKGVVVQVGDALDAEGGAIDIEGEPEDRVGGASDEGLVRVGDEKEGEWEGTSELGAGVFEKGTW